MLINFLVKTEQVQNTFLFVCFVHENMKTTFTKVRCFSKIEDNFINVPAALTVQTAQTKLTFSNVAYRSTV